MTIPTDFNSFIQTKNKSSSFGQLKKKFETKAMTTQEILRQDVPELSIVKMLRTSKVKGMASLFNTKIALQNAEIEKDRSNTNTSAKVAYTQNIKENKLLSQDKDNHKQQPIAKPRSKTLPNTRQITKTYFQPEDKFSKLTVKDKVSLYNQFVNEMSQKNPKFVKHAELLEAQAKKGFHPGGVVSEKQASVKQILAKLEAKCSLPRQTLNPWAEQKLQGIKKNYEQKSKNGHRKPMKSKEFEDTRLLEKSLNHITSLTVKLRPSNVVGMRKKRRSKTLPGYKNYHVNDLQAQEELDTNKKRNNEQMRYSVPLEAYAPPRKIRRTRAERLAPKIFFQSEELENLFFTWLNGKEQGQKTEIDREANVDQLLEKTLKKLEVLELESFDGDTGPESPTALNTHNNSFNSSPEKFKIYGEYESGLSSLSKITSDESQNENPLKKNDQIWEFSKPTRAQRKKKLRRTLTWKNQPSEETKPFPHSNSTDSDSEAKIAEMKFKNKMLFMQKPLTIESDDKDVATQLSSEELDNNLIRKVNAPNKIKSVYTLTAVTSSPSPEQGEEKKVITTTQVLTPSSKAPHKTSSSDISNPNASNIFDSFIDQGFETGSNEVESPERVIKPTNKLDPITPDGSSKIKTAFDFSTPIKDQQTYQFANTTNQQQQQYSPITKSLKLRRRSLYDNESRRSSVTMQVIREDQPLEQHEITASRSLNPAEQNFYKNASTKEMSNSSFSASVLEQNSQFWIKCGDFTLCFDILHYEADRLRLLYEVFCQRNSDSQDLHFGIDNLKFSLHDAFDKENISQRLPKSQEFSHFWFSTGDLVIPFVGRRLAAERTQRIFELLKIDVQQTGILQFGVDNLEFSSLPEFNIQSPKYSMDSNYSMLVGLQSGSSNGLEGRGKYAWPNSKPARVSDFDSADYFCEDLTETDSADLSPFGGTSKQFDLPSSSPNEQRVSNCSLKNQRESFGLAYENETLDNLFNETQKLPAVQQKAAVPHFNTIKTQQKHFSSLQEKLAAYKNQALYKETPEYIEQLKTKVAEIINKGSRVGFKNCTVKELESYMCILSHYAHICIEKCTCSLDKVLDALLDQRAQLV